MKNGLFFITFCFIIALVGAFVLFIGYEGVMLVQKNTLLIKFILPSPIFKLSTTIVFSTVGATALFSKCYKYPKTKFSFPGSEDISVEVTANLNAKKEF